MTEKRLAVPVIHLPRRNVVAMAMRTMERLALEVVDFLWWSANIGSFAGGIGDGGFSFGGATATPANTPAKSKRGRDDDSSSKAPAVPLGGAGFTFGGASSGGDEKNEE